MHHISIFLPLLNYFYRMDKLSITNVDEDLRMINGDNRSRRHIKDENFDNIKNNSSIIENEIDDHPLSIVDNKLNHHHNDSDGHDDENLLTTSNNIPQTTTSFDMNSTTESPLLQPSATNETLSTFQSKVTVFTEYAQIKDLKHYTEYIIEVVACQDDSKERKFCSVSAITSIKTLPLPGADDINKTFISYSFENSTSSSLSSVTLRWRPPTDPNGFILSYEIEYQSEEFPKQFICISSNDHHRNDNGYNIKLPSGNYSFRLRALSLADYGNWTEPIYVYIEEPANANFKFVIIAIFIIFILTIIIAIVYYKYRVNQNKLDYISVNPDYINSNFSMYFFSFIFRNNFNLYIIFRL